MNQAQVMSLVRGFLQIAGTLAVAYGFMSETQWEPIAGGVAMLASFAWGMWTHTDANSVATTAAMSEVAKVEIKRTEAGETLLKKTTSTPDALVVFTPR